VPAEITRGTAPRPATVSQGFFKWPAGGGVVSNFGTRWGRLHAGLDIGVRYGPVYSADGGTVVYAGARGDGYGIKIIIDHGYGKRTLYAHLSKLMVSAGDKVYQGQRIATSGNTGNSTGPHLHFEIHINGAPKNPLKYL
jgi:murein DD-endopeptidase MepM/ murein hydrolase activator NlpD